MRCTSFPKPVGESLPYRRTARVHATRGMMSLSAGIQDHRGGESTQLHIPEGFLEGAQLEVSNPDRKSGSSLKTQRDRVKEDHFLQSTIGV